MVQLFVGAVVLPLLLMALVGWQILEYSQRYKQITVGMTVEEVVDLLGETSRQTRAGEPLEPPVVTVPAGMVYEYACTWLCLDRFVYVLFDEDGRVVAIYTYDT